MNLPKIPILLLFLTLCLVGYMNSYVLFKPVYLEADALIVSSRGADDTFYQNLELVLQKYNVPYKKSDDNRILVPRRLWLDRDTMWNYTTKANGGHRLKPKPPLHPRCNDSCE